MAHHEVISVKADMPMFILPNGQAATAAADAVRRQRVEILRNRPTAARFAAVPFLAKLALPYRVCGDFSPSTRALPAAPTISFIRGFAETKLQGST
jgi:hypothetical protein